MNLTATCTHMKGCPIIIITYVEINTICIGKFYCSKIARTSCIACSDDSRYLKLICFPSYVSKFPFHVSCHYDLFHLGPVKLSDYIQAESFRVCCHKETLYRSQRLVTI